LFFVDLDGYSAISMPIHATMHDLLLKVLK